MKRRPITWLPMSTVKQLRQVSMQWGLGAPWLAHKASHEGVLVAEKIAGQSVKPINPIAIPGCTYSYPQIASVGLTGAQAQKGL